MIDPFPTIFGRNLVAELGNFAPLPFLLTSTADLEPLFAGDLGSHARVYRVHSV